MNIKAKERAQIENSASVTKARAIVVSNSMKATVLKFIQSFNKYDYPQQIFSDWNEAYNWLIALK